MIITKFKKNIILLFFISVSIFASCNGNDNKMNFSFEQIQDLYGQEIKQQNVYNLCPFYVKKNFFNKVEDELNELIAKSDFCSVRICVNIDNGRLDVAALYNQESEIYFTIM